MKTKFNKSHHWPNIIAHFVIGVVGIGVSAFMVALPVVVARNEGGRNIWIWVLAAMGLFVFPFVFRIAWTPLGYLKKVDLGDDSFIGSNFFGKEYRIRYTRISKCFKTTTAPKYGSGNPAVVVRTKQFPFHLGINLKGYSDRKAELLSMAVNHRMAKLESRKKVNS